MNATEMQNRLSLLRTGFDRAIEATLRHKAENGWPIVVAGPDGVPHTEDAAAALDRFLKRKEGEHKPATV